MPTRFKYATVQPQSFALTPAEILMATDAELNQYIGVKRYAPYRKEARWDPTRVDRLKELKGKVAERSGKIDQDVDGTKKRKDGQKPRKGKKERQMLKAAALSVPRALASAGDEAAEGNDAGKDIQKKRKLNDDENAGEAEEGGKRKRRRHKMAAQV
jgi:protein KRI1